MTTAPRFGELALHAAPAGATRCGRLSVKPDPIIFELLAFRPVRVVLLLLFFLAVTLTLSYVRAEEAGITARIGALQVEVQRLDLQVSWLIAHARSQ